MCNRWTSGMHIALAILTLLVSLSCVAQGNPTPPVAVEQEHIETSPQDIALPKKTPVENFGSWWPAVQFRDDSAVAEEVVRQAIRPFSRIAYDGIATPWGGASVSLSPMDDGYGLRFDLVWSGPGTGAAEEWNKHQSPEPGDVRAAIIVRDATIGVPTNGVPQIIAWVGGSLGTSGGMLICFDWVPSDFDDYWVRVDVLEERHWFLIPYGLGSEQAKSMQLPQVDKDGPTRPMGAEHGDVIHSWSSVYYDLGELKEAGCRVSVRIANPFDTIVDLELYRETGPWSLHSPRTSVTYIRPSGWTRFATLKTISKPDHYRRNDHYEFWRTPHEVRGWGLFRLTVEEQVVDVAVPSSLFHYSHAYIPRD